MTTPDPTEAVAAIANAIAMKRYEAGIRYYTDEPEKNFDLDTQLAKAVLKALAERVPEREDIDNAPKHLSASAATGWISGFMEARRLILGEEE